MTDVEVPLFAGVARGRWCDQCQTSAGYTVPVYAFDGADGPRLVKVVAGCQHCEDVTRTRAG